MDTAFQNSFAAWREITLAGPREAARFWLERLSELPEGARRSALAVTLGEDVLAGGFAAAAENPDAPLCGTPFVVKDLFDVAGYPTRAGSAFFEQIQSVPERSNGLVEKCLEAGAVFAGKTHMQEFALGLEGTNPHFGNVPHTRFPMKLSGGSSSGSAWAVASGLTPFALASDTAGSIRVPASWNGIYGLRLRPWESWISRGAVPLAPSCDAAGWFTASAGDMAATVECLLTPNRGKRTGAGLYVDDFGVEIEGELLAAYRATAEKLGLVTENTPFNEVIREEVIGLEAVFPVLGTREAYKYHIDWLDKYKDSYDPVVWARINAGRNRTEAEISGALDRRERIRDALAGLFIDFDYLVMPAVHRTAPLLHELDDGLRNALLRLNVGASLAALPSLLIPVTLESGLSGGLQVIYPNNYSPAPLHVLGQLV